METVKGIIEKYTFYNEENGYAVLRMMLLDGQTEDDRFTATGHIFGAELGESVELSGEWVVHPRFGLQFNFEHFAIIVDESPLGIERFLSSGLINGIGPKMAHRIVEHFGEKTFEVLDKTPERLREVKGIGQKTYESIIESYTEQMSLRGVMMFLQSYGISTRYAVKLFRAYGERTVEKLRENPYRMVEEVSGIGFKIADKIASQMMSDVMSPFRLGAGLVYALTELTYLGNTYTEKDYLLDGAIRLMDLSATEDTREKLIEALVLLIEDEKIIVEEDRVYLPLYYKAEEKAAQKLFKLMHTPFFAPFMEPDEVLSELEADAGFPFSDEQRKAIGDSLSAGVTVVTGGPGTGKTTIIRGLLALYQRMGLRIALTAPTGRAAKRMTESTGMEAKTIHRLLEFEFEEGDFVHFQHNSANPVAFDVVIADEMSMVDMLLFHSLVDALAPGTRLILVGDIDQLPAVAAGNVLEDIIDSGRVNVVRLNQIFRQAETSMIVVNAHRIHEGLIPKVGRDVEDFYFFEQNSQQGIRDLVVELVSRKMPGYFNMDPWDIQVLTPMKKTPAGTAELNMCLQEALNPPHPEKAELTFGTTKFRLGDRVMQVKNDYQKEVFNGDVGRVYEIEERGALSVEYRDGGVSRLIRYDETDLDQLMLCYAISIHKSQGSEFPAVVIPLTLAHSVMLQRNLLYTAITRAKQTVVLVGQKEALLRAVQNDRQRRRNSTFKLRLVEAFGGE